MIKTVIIKVNPNFDIHRIMEGIEELGFKFDRLSQITDQFILIVGSMDITNIMMLRSVDGVDTFQVDKGVERI